MALFVVEPRLRKPSQRVSFAPAPGGLATQGDLLLRGLLDIGVETHAAHLKSDLEKEWYYRWFRPDVVVGIGFWGDVPDVVLHPRRFGVRAVPWLLADGYVANYRETFIRDGIRGDHTVTLPVGCDTDAFIPRPPEDPKVRAVRDSLGMLPGELMILTVGGDDAKTPNLGAVYVKLVDADKRKLPQTGVMDRVRKEITRGKALTDAATPPRRGRPQAPNTRRM